MSDGIAEAERLRAIRDALKSGEQPAHNNIRYSHTLRHCTVNMRRAAAHYSIYLRR